MRGNKNILRSIAGAVIALTFLATMISAAYFLTAFIYMRTGFTLPMFVVQVLNSLLGLFLAFLVLFVFGTVFRARRAEMELGIFGPIIDAMEKIAKGDFNVKLEDTPHNAGVAGALVKSVNKMAVELTQMEAMRQEFISNVSHEIQSPLTSIRGFARALHNDNLSPEDRTHYLNIVETESMRLSKLSDNLLELASLDSEHIKFEPESYRLDKQIRSLILACEPQWLAKGIDMDVCLEEVIIKADEDLLSQLWINLIHNSIKFTPDGGCVRIVLQAQENTIHFSISDTGIGIAEEDQAHVFERFYKADKSRLRTKEGSGLGLAIAKKIVDIHHGTICVQSRLGSGTTFTLSLPLP